jgi:hypothetical protein
MRTAERARHNLAPGFHGDVHHKEGDVTGCFIKLAPLMLMNAIGNRTVLNKRRGR